MSEAVAEESKRDGRMHVIDASSRAKGLAKSVVVERVWTPDREAMLTALRVALGLPRVPPSWLEGLR
jgi:hypothetical protein